MFFKKSVVTVVLVFVWLNLSEIIIESAGPATDLQ